MQSNSLLKWSLSIVPFKRITFFSVIIFFIFFGLSAQVSYTKSTSPISSKPVELVSNVNFEVQTGSGLPVRLKIPKIKLDVAIEQVGLTPQGAVGVPKGIKNVAWFDLWPRPGDSGNAIITGHYGYWKNGLPAVFNNLYKLKKGDKLYVVDEMGTTTTFVVRENRKYNPNADAKEIFSSKDGNSHLNIITCQGTWISNLKSYTNRLVIFADKEI